MKIFTQIQFCILLITPLGKAQKVTVTNDQTSCNDHQYFQEQLEKCCSRCPPGSYMKKECTDTSDTQCQQCGDRQYTSSWNYAEKCRRCQSCAPHLVEKENCSTTKKEVCVCPEGYNCIQHDGVGVCLVCKPVPTATVLLPSEPSVTQVTPAYPWVLPVIIVVVVIIILVVLIILLVCLKTWILEKLGCMAKVKKPLPESSAGGTMNSKPTHQTLLLETDLRYPMEETDATQSAEYALNSINRHPI